MGPPVSEGCSSERTRSPVACASQAFSPSFCFSFSEPEMVLAVTVASRAGYSQMCCFEDADYAGPTVSCPEIVDWGADLTTSCANHHTNLYRTGAVYGMRTSNLPLRVMLWLS